VRNPRTPVFLNWVADRFVNIHDESENVDFVRRIRHEASKAQTLLTNLSSNTRTYKLVDLNEVDADGYGTYTLMAHGTTQVIRSHLRLTTQQAEDLARQLDAPIDYFND
jgi:hypothetical protein